MKRMAESARQISIEQEETTARQTQVRGRGTVVALQTVTVGFPKKSLVFGILMAFALCFTILYRYCMVSEMNLQLGRMNREYSLLRENGRMLKVEIESSLQLDAIRMAAEARFAMHEPSMNQVVPVLVPKSQYSIVTDPAYIHSVSDPGRSLVNRILDAMGAVMP